MLLQETIFCATAPSSGAGSGAGSISLHDIQTGSTLASFKQTSAGIHCTALVESHGSEGGFILSSQPDKSIMNVYNFQKDQITQKIVLPEKLSCVVVDRKGEFCAGGTFQGRIYLWEVASGILYNSWDAHYRKVNVLQFTYDGAALLSGSEDSHVNVWSLSRLLDDELQNELPTPYCMLSDHTLPITDVICGIGPFPSCRVLTSSVDHTTKLWDLSSKSLLTTFHFPKPISCLAWDMTERMFFAASAEGSIHQVNLFRQREDKLGPHVMEAVGGAGAADIIRIEDEDPEAKKKRLIMVSQPITALAISLTSSLLLVGTSAGLIHIYDIASHQLLRSITTHNGFTITCLTSILKPPDLIGHINLSLNVGGAADAKDAIPVKPVVPFQRMRDSKSREKHEVLMLLSTQDPIHTFSDDYDTEELMRDHMYFVKPSSNTAPSTASLQSHISELEGEVIRLREQLGKAKGVNDVMWETVVQRVIASGKSELDDTDEIAMDVDGSEEHERRRKRGRT